MIWFWVGMVCGGPVVVGIRLLGFCGELVVVDGYGMSFMVFFFFFWGL